MGTRTSRNSSRTWRKHWMEIKAAIVTTLLILGLVIIALGILSWVSSILTRYGMPDEALVIIAGLLLIVFTIIAARMLEEK